MSHFSLHATVKSYPKLPYQKIKTDILGTDHTIELTLIGEDRAQTLNQTYRKKDYIPNVLSFPHTPDYGEIFICPRQAKREAPRHNMTYRGFVGFLFIHALLHLKGHTHGATMTKQEARYAKAYRLA